jgi:hypothetical protein
MLVLERGYYVDVLAECVSTCNKIFSRKDRFPVLLYNQHDFEGIYIFATLVIDVGTSSSE